MTVTETLTSAERFSLVLGGLCRAVAARIAGGAMAAAMIVLVWGRIKRIERQVLGLLARYRAGRLLVGAARGSCGGGRPGGGAAVLPRGFGWLLPLVPQWAAGYGSQLRVVLAEPEMVALLTAAPQARRLLRPLCRMLAIEAVVLAPGDGPQGAPASAEGAADPVEAPVDPHQIPACAGSSGAGGLAVASEARSFASDRRCTGLG